ncbi:GPR182 isoform 2, partial [Pan troglodytes]
SSSSCSTQHSIIITKGDSQPAAAAPHPEPSLSFQAPHLLPNTSPISPTQPLTPS